MSDAKKKVQEALAEKRRQLQNIKENRKTQATTASAEPTSTATVSFYFTVLPSSKDA
jgi:vacuolar-type H+-ATPase subunit E/Vma4